MEKMEKKDWYPETDQEYGETAEAFKTYLSDSTNLGAQGWDAQSNADVNQKITGSIIPKATVLDTAYKDVHVNGNDSSMAKELLAIAINEFKEWVPYMYRQLKASSKPDATKVLAYTGLHLIPGGERAPRSRSPIADYTEAFVVAIGEYSLRNVVIRMMGNTKDGSHRLEKGQIFRRFHIGYVPKDVNVYPPSIFLEVLETNRKITHYIVPANVGGMKMVIYAVIVNNLREEGLQGQFVTINLPTWDIEDEEARDAQLFHKSHPELFNPDGTPKTTTRTDDSAKNATRDSASDNSES